MSVASLIVTLPVLCVMSYTMLVLGLVSCVTLGNLKTARLMALVQVLPAITIYQQTPLSTEQYRWSVQQSAMAKHAPKQQGQTCVSWCHPPISNPIFLMTVSAAASSVLPLKGAATEPRYALDRPGCVHTCRPNITRNNNVALLPSVN